MFGLTHEYAQAFRGFPHLRVVLVLLDMHCKLQTILRVYVQYPTKDHYGQFEVRTLAVPVPTIDNTFSSLGIIIVAAIYNLCQMHS